MTGKPSSLKRGGLARSLGVSIAGVRVGGAFAIDGVLQKLKSGEDKAPSAFARREARRQSRYLAAHVRPTLAQKAQYPERTKLIALLTLFSFLTWSIICLVYYSLRDRS